MTARAAAWALALFATAARADPPADPVEFGHRFDREFRGCYQRSLQLEPWITARVEMRFVIDRDGHARDVRAVVSTPAPLLQRCLEGVIRRAVFPRRRSAVRVVMPLATDRP